MRVGGAGEMGPAYLATFTSDRVVDWRVQAQFVRHSTTTSYWCHDDGPNGSLRVLEIKKV